MFGLFGVILSAILFSTVGSQSVISNWTAFIDSDFGYRSSEFARLGDGGLAIAYFKIDYISDKSEFFIQSFDKFGISRKICRLDVKRESLNGRVEDQFIAIGESDVVYSSVKTTSENQVYLTLIVVNTVRCSSHFVRLKINEFEGRNEWRYRYYERYIYPVDNYTFEVFIWAPSVCKTNLCRIFFGRPGMPMNMIPKSESFVSYNGLDYWRIMPVDSRDYSKGYYYFLHDRTDYDNRMTRIMKLSSNGKLLKSTEMHLGLLTMGESFSNSYGNLGFCTKRAPEEIICTLSDSSLVRKINVKFDLPGRRGEYWVYWTDMVNTKDGGFIVYIFECRSFGVKLCKLGEFKGRKIEADGSIGQEIIYPLSEGDDSIKTHIQELYPEIEDTHCNYFLKPVYINWHTYANASVEAKCMSSL